MGAVIALAGLSVAVWSGYISWLAWRQQETNSVELAAKLAQAVFRKETLARHRLLGGHDRSIDVDFLFRSSPHHDAVGADASGHLNDIVSYYRALTPHRLVITGEAGAGKTVLALELVLGLLQDRNPEDPVPLRLPLSSWNNVSVRGPSPKADPDPAAALRTWVCQHLVDDYGMSLVAAQTLFDAGKMLPVLDGLDEMDSDGAPGWASRARKALEVLNSYQQGRKKASLVLTCRSDQYRALIADRIWVQDAAWIEIGSVGLAKARSFIEGRASDPTRWHHVLEALERAPSEPVAGALSTPWRLTLAAVVYEQRNPDTGHFLREPTELLNPMLATPEAVRDHLLSHFVEAAAATSPTGLGARHTPSQIHTWLHTLAAYLSFNAVSGGFVTGLSSSAGSHTDLVMHELWLLPAHHRPGLVRAFLYSLSGPWMAIFVMTAAMLARPRETHPLIFIAVILAIVALLLYLMRPAATTHSIGPNHPWVRSGPSDFALGIVGGFLSSIAFGIGFELLGGMASWLVFALAFSLGVGLHAGSPGVSKYRRRGGRVVFPFWVGGGVALGIVSHFGDIFVSYPVCWAVVTLGMLIWLWFSVGDSLVSSGMRFMALLACTRWGASRLPWRLGDFLRWAETAGLVRVAGAAYQFRHLELQVWLANPENRPRGR
ncbi:NACHT domain-containing protein [Streptomyces tricolor]|uniref:NACHT domain-containing protein n=1 Tax=Streptomyces TaxID=1883 RepID=UPI001AD7F0ED|nr:NACHT domain-containing protein [Streptomyces sp. PBH53]